MANVVGKLTQFGGSEGFEVCGSTTLSSTGVDIGASMTSPLHI
jgi:hypothetical protein